MAVSFNFEYFIYRPLLFDKKIAFLYYAHDEACLFSD